MVLSAIHHEETASHLGIDSPFWGVLVAAPLIAVLYAYKERYQETLMAAAK
jgi:hypothetical protein